MTPKRALTGIQPTGDPHIGNYLGMIKPALKLQETHDTFYFIADYHSLTALRDPQKMRDNTYALVATMVALGMDVENHAFYRQSDIPEVTELTWFLACVTSMGLLERSHAYKDAVASGKEPNLGLLSYPVLMAADILLYDTNYVPVGQDQRQHLEMTRDIAIRFNHIFGETLIVPEALIADDVATIPGLDGRKMSKSYGNTIPVFSTEKKLRKLVMKIVTDSKTVEESKDPETCSVFALYKLFASQDQQDELAKQYRAGGMGYGVAKQAVFEVINEELKEAREIYFEIHNDYQKLDGILESGRDKARPVAQEVLNRTREKVGF